MTHLHTVRVLVSRQTPLDRARLGGSDHPCARDNGALRYPGDIGDFARRVFLDTLFEFLKTVGPVFDEVLVVQFLVDDDVEETESQGAVGAGTQLADILTASSQPGHPRIDMNHLGATLHHVDQGVTEETVRV